jgi:hypothetical protein
VLLVCCETEDMDVVRLLVVLPDVLLEFYGTPGTSDSYEPTSLLEDVVDVCVIRRLQDLDTSVKPGLDV